MAPKGKIDDAKLEELIRASDNGEKWAQDEYGRIFDEYDMDPDFIDRVCRARVNIYREPAKRGDKNAILRYAHALAHLGYEKEAYGWYISLINKGDTDAMLALSEQYNEYGCFGHNSEEEIKWLKLAASKGNAEAQCKMGRECLCVSDYYNALLWYELSAKQNHCDGKIGYAKCLQDQLSALYEYSNGWKEVAPGRYKYIKKTYGDLPQQKCPSEMSALYDRIEALYLEGLNHSNSTTYLSDAFTGLSFLYLYPQGVCAPMPYLAAFYEFEHYRVLDNKLAYDRCLEIIKSNNLRVTQNDLKEWDKIGVFDWAKKHGIDISRKTAQKPSQSPNPSQHSKTQKPKTTTTKETDNQSLDINLILYITAEEARNGCEKIITVKETGKNHSVSIPAGIKNGEVLRLRGAGKQNPSTNQKGHVFLKIQIKEVAGTSSSQTGTKGFLKLTVRNTLNPLGLAHGTKYHFVIDGKQEIILIAEKKDVSTTEEMSHGNHTMYLEVYGYNDSVADRKPIYKVKQFVFSIQSGKTTSVSADRGSFLNAPKITIN